MNSTVIKEFELEAGHAAVHKLYGKDARELMRICVNGGDTSELNELLIIRSVTINDKPITFEMLSDMSFEDYIGLVNAVAENFTPTVRKGS